MTVVSVADVRALVDTDLSDADLETVIAREEAALARVIGPLDGPRTQTFYPDAHPETFSLPLILARPTDAVTLSDNGQALASGDYRLHPNGLVIERMPGWTYWHGPMAATYTPNDLLEVQRVLIELTRLTVTETGYLSETIGDYSYSRGARGGSLNPTEAARSRLIQGLIPPLVASTSRLTSSRAWTYGRGWIANWNDPYA